MKSIKFSVLVPVYNAEKYLRECIESILNQTYQNFELILVNDGSTDSSGNICDEYALLNDKIKVVHKENQGLVLARREAIRKATGDFVMFLDSDDCFRLDSLEIIEKSVNEQNCDLIIFNASKEKDFATKNWELGFKDGQIFEGDNKNLLYEKIITSSLLNSLCFKAVKRELIDVENDYKEFSFVTSTEDLLQSLPIIDSCKKALYIDETLYFYRQHGNSMVHNFNYKSYLSIKTVHGVLLKYIYKWNKQEFLQKYYSKCIGVALKYAYLIVLSKQEKKEKINSLKELAEDKYFIEACTDFDESKFKNRDLYFIKLLFAKRVKKFYFLFKFKNKIRQGLNLLYKKN